MDLQSNLSRMWSSWKDTMLEIGGKYMNIQKQCPALAQPQYPSNRGLQNTANHMPNKQPIRDEIRITGVSLGPQYVTH